ncbi:MAG: hypothetical protein LQ338_006774 [Usnochroma carphineum]|nr:MAG: hypothetical protein LQ338_006774 [Usnochroma carphineum]
MSKGISSGDDGRPDVNDLEGDNEWTQLARKHWSSPVKSRRVKNEVVKNEIWDVLENGGFPFRSLLILENLQLLENYLWPGLTDSSTNHHVLLIALIATVKNRENLQVWDTFTSDGERFSSLFRRVLSMSLDSSLSAAIRTHILSFLISAFQSLDNGLIRKECAPLVSISVWHYLSSEAIRERKFEQHAPLKKAWRAAARKFDSADEAAQAKLRFDRAWLYSLMLDFIGRLQESSTDNVVYCERFLEFLTDIESQLPTRRYVNTLIKDLNLLSFIRLSPMFHEADNGLFRDLFVLLRHFVHFPVDDNTGVQHTQVQSYEEHCARLARLQRVSLKNFKEKLTILALSNYAAIDKREDLEAHLEPLSDAELTSLSDLLGFRTRYPPASKVDVTRALLIETLLSAHERRRTFRELISHLNVLPTEAALYEPTLLRNEHYDGSRSLAIPKLNLQYLSVGDFLWRSFVLHRCESFFEIRKDIEETTKRLRPQEIRLPDKVRFDGFSKMAIPISKPAQTNTNSPPRIIEAAPPKVGRDTPAFVRAEVGLDVSRLAESVRREWESLRQDDVVYLLAVDPAESSRNLTNGHAAHATSRDFGIRYLRAAEVEQVLDDNGRVICDQVDSATNGYVARPRLRRLLVKLDAAAYKTDNARKSEGQPDVYESINLIVRRRGRENNFKKILETIRSLALSDIPVPDWLQEVFLGFGDPTSATYTKMPNSISQLDFRDTFLDWKHLVESLPDRVVESSSREEANIKPPFILQGITTASSERPRPSKKRRRDDDDVSQPAPKSIRVSTYRPPNNGPYPTDAPKTNQIRFTPVQVEAIMSGTQPGLTVIVGPPGTGKTDVATQIINNIYHNFPSQRTLLIAHSNQALNQLFQKITNLDIDERHLLRLGHGEEDLETDVSYSKHGRVESFLDNRGHYLAEVDRLAANFQAPGAHGNSCETAGYFNSVYVAPAWSKFWDHANSEDATTSDIISSFPFHQYFSNAPQPLFPPDASRDQILDIARGCQRHIERIFTELEDIRPFEILRTSRDKANYLLIKEARIIAMTSTHAAIRRQEIADLGFHYDNVIMEEAAQITEIENFIPLALQNPKDGQLPLQRVVLCGDHLQNSPIVQNLAFRQFANLEQSLFLRFVRLGVPTINLDHQGRARPSIAELYKWRYPKLENLPNVLTETEYLRANAGFRYEYQFIDVPDYKGTGESQPTPHYFQNLGEAEYAVAIYQYMRLLGCPASKISILTTYAGQRALIRDVLGHRCASNRLFGLPRLVTTVDKYQGEQNDCEFTSYELLAVAVLMIHWDADIILSLVRTTRVGYLRDIRRLTVALSRARLGLYILGRRSVFETCYELREAFAKLFERPNQLLLTTGELFPASRLLGDDVEATEMTGVEHLGQYVYEMTQAKIESLETGGVQLPPVEETPEMMKVDAEQDREDLVGEGLEGDGQPEPEGIDGVT